MKQQKDVFMTLLTGLGAGIGIGVATNGAHSFSINMKQLVLYLSLV